MALGNLNLIQRLARPPEVRWKHVFLTLLGAFMWTFFVHARPWVIQTRCANNPASCSAASVPAIDQYALSHDSPRADELSYETQNFSGFWAYAVPIGFEIGKLALGATPPGAVLSFIFQDSLIISETIVFNGALNEVARLVFQRPRPFVYQDPGYHGSDPQNYTSFYSGHTSFTAAANTALILLMLGRTTSIALLVLVGTSGPLLIFFTGFFRVLAGRHFFTDVIAGAIAGGLVALFFALLHRPLHRTKKNAA